MNLDRLESSGSHLALRLLNAAASSAVVGLACGVYALAPYNSAQMRDLYGIADLSFTGTAFLFSIAAAYSALLAVYYLVDPQPRVSKSLRFFNVLVAFLRSPAKAFQTGLTATDRVATLTTLLKAFFAPFMVMALMQHVLGALANGVAMLAPGGATLGMLEMFNRHGYWVALKLILFIDVVIFTVGYLVESPRLGNEIKSVDPTLLGWAAALLCYPPFNTVTAAVLGSSTSDFPQFDDPTVHLALNVLLLGLMAIYASASVALGLKASNLTHRGIVARGPYAWVRHPAYAAKNLAWWIAAVPLVSAAFSMSVVDGLTALASVVGWTMLYMLRAVTEEDHLRSVDDHYAAYAARVRFRFIPGVL